MAITGCVLSVLLITAVDLVGVQANFDFTVHFFEYWNPTGLCGECGESIIPVCCDDVTRAWNCSNHGEVRCDTRFRFIQRPYGASVQTAPTTNYQDFTRSRTNENHEIFKEGPGGFLAIPNPFTRTNTTAWTGKIQLHVDALDVDSDNITETVAIIDRFPINLQLQLGSNFTQRTIYDGIYNIAHLSMSFKVECSTYYYGPDCTTFCKEAEGQYNCDSKGHIECIQDNYNSTNGCVECLSGWDLATNCTQCQTSYDNSTNCTQCLEGYIGTKCIKDPCVENPCDIGETCIADATTGEFKCQCTSESKCGLTPNITRYAVEIVLGIICALFFVIGITLVIILTLYCRIRMSKHSSETQRVIESHEGGYGTSDQSITPLVISSENIHLDSESKEDTKLFTDL